MKKKHNRKGLVAWLMDSGEYYIIDARPEMKEEPVFTIQSKTLADNVCKAMNLAYRVGVTIGMSSKNI